MAGMDFNLTLNAITKGLQKGMDEAKSAVNALVAAVAVLGVGLGVRELAQAADSYTNLSARINIATQDGGNFTQAMAGVHQIALATNSSLEATGTLFTKINDTGKQMGLTQQQSLDLTKTINQAIQIGGGSASASEAAITQLSQALQSGVLRGDEFNSIMEQAPGLTKALAAGLSVTTGELRKMAENGELTAERVVKAIQSQSDEVQATYDKFPTTIGNALQRISTSWDILIGKMDQASGTSSQVAEWLTMLADNIQNLQVFIEDIGEGFVWVGDKLQSIDSSTIEALKTTLSEAYETVKSLIANVATFGETMWSAFTSALDAVSPLFAAIATGTKEVSGLETVLNYVRLALAGVADMASILNIAFKTILSAIQFLSAGLLAFNGQVLDFIGLDALAEQAISASDRMFAQAEKNASEASKLAINHKSALEQTYADINKTQEEKNLEKLQNNQETLNQLKAQEEKHKTDYKAISDERIALEQQLYEARKTGNQASIEQATKGLAELDAKEKAYQAESKKIQDEKIAAAQAIADAMVAANGKISESELKVLNAKLAAQGLKAEFDGTGKVIVSAMDQGIGATGALVNAAAQARKGAEALGLDLDVALNRVSKKFSTNAVQLENFAKGLEGFGVKGAQAAEVTYQAWLKWLETAKSPAEIDFAKQKLDEFEKKGVFSTKQVEMGVDAIRRANMELPDELDETGRAFELLGIKTKEQLRLSAQVALSAFNTIQQSGQATTGQLQKAYERVVQAAHASGDAGVIAATDAKAASLGLAVQVNETGETTVSAMSQADQSVNQLSRSADNAGRSFRGMGREARESAQEAKQSIDAWNDALTAKSDAQAKERAESKSSKAVGGSFSSYSKADVLNELRNLGYDDKEAQKLAGSIMSSALAADKSTMQKNMGTGNAKYLNDAYEKLLSQGLTSSSGSSVVQKRLADLASGKGAVSVSAPADSGPISTRRLEIVSGGQTATVTGSANDVDAMESILGKLEMLRKSS